MSVDRSEIHLGGTLYVLQQFRLLRLRQQLVVDHPAHHHRTALRQQRELRLRLQQRMQQRVR